MPTLLNPFWQAAPAVPIHCKRVTAASGTAASGTKTFSGFVDRSGSDFTPIVYLYLRNLRTTAGYGVFEASQGIGFGVASAERSVAWTQPNNALSSFARASHRADCSAEGYKHNNDSSGRHSFNSFAAGSIVFDIDDPFGVSELHTILGIGGSGVAGKVVEITEPGATGDQDITVSGLGGTPTLIIFLGSSALASLPQAPNDIRLMFGAVVPGGGQVVYAGGSNHGSDPTVCGQYLQNTECMAGMNALITGIDSRASFVSAGNETFRINWAAVSGGVRIYYALVFTGVTAQVGTFVCPTTLNGTVDVATPKRVRGGLVFGAQQRTAISAAGTSTAESFLFSIGAFDSTSSRASHTAYDSHAANTTAPSLGHANDGVAQFGDSAQTQKIDVSDITDSLVQFKAVDEALASILGYVFFMDS